MYFVEHQRNRDSNVDTAPIKGVPSRYGMGGATVTHHYPRSHVDLGMRTYRQSCRGEITSSSGGHLDEMGVPAYLLKKALDLSANVVPPVFLIAGVTGTLPAAGLTNSRRG